MPPPPPPLSSVRIEPAIRDPDFYANGPLLVMRKDAALPDRCIHCNAPTEGQTYRKRLIWADLPKEPSGGLAARLILPLKVIHALQDMARFIGSLRTFTGCTVDLPICAKHFRSRCFWNPLAWLAIPGGIAAAALIEDMYVRIWMPFVGVALTLLARARSHHVAAAHIGITHVTLRGVGADFLASLPPREDPKEQPSDLLTILVSTAVLKERMKGKRSEL